MASWVNPKLANKIADDVPGIQAALIALTKLDPSTITAGLPNGARRIATVSGGNQLQSYNGTSWTSIGKLIHDVDQLDGYHANTGSGTSAKNTIPVRNADGNLPGNITGNAATASKASAISFTVGINQGGTGKTTAADARTALGVPPTSHAVNANTYGIGTSSVFGHVKIVDTHTGNQTAASGIAISPKALYDAIGQLTGTVGGYLPLTGGTLSGNLTESKNLTVNGTTTLKTTNITGATLTVTTDANLNKENSVVIKAPMNLGNVWLNHVNIGFRTFLVDPDTKNSYVTQRMTDMYPFKVLNHVDNADHGAKDACGFAVNSPNALVLFAGDNLGSLVNGFNINGETNIVADSWTEHLILAADSEMRFVTNANKWSSRRLSAFTANGQLALGGSGCTDGTTAATASAGRTVLSPRNISTEILRSTLQGYIYGDAPSANTGTQIVSLYSTSGKNAAGTQVNETRIACLETSCNKDGNNVLQLIIRNKTNNGWLTLGVTTDGYGYCPTPAANASGTHIATTAWVRDRCTNRMNGTKNEAVTQTSENQGVNQTLAYNSTNNKIVISNNYDNTLVHRAGTETISGAKTFTANMVLAKAGPTFNLKNTGVERNVAPSANQAQLIWFLDKNGKRLGYIQNVYYTDKKNLMQIVANKGTTTDNAAASIGIGYDKNGNWFTAVPQPANEDNTSKIANTAWVHTAIGGYLGGTWGPKTKYATESFVSTAVKNLGDTCVKLTGNQTVAGNKTFSGTTSLAGNSLCTGNFYSQGFIKKHSSVTKGTNPSGTQYWCFGAYDKNGTGYGANCIGLFEVYLDKNGKVNTHMRALKNEASSEAACEIACVYDKASNTAYTSAPTPADNDNTTKIATTAWVQKFCGTTKKYLTSHQSLSDYYKKNSRGATLQSGQLEVYHTYPLVDFHRSSGDYANDSTDFTTRICECAANKIWIRAHNVDLGDGQAGGFFSPNGGITLGTDSARWGQLYTSKNPNVSSDERLKQDIMPIPEELLDAWEGVQLCLFRYIKSVQEGNSDRYHAGVIAQQVKKDLKSKNGVDAHKYGFFCYDEWEDEYIEDIDKIPAEYDKEGNLVKEASIKTKKVLKTKKGNEYSIRYEQFLVIEAAYHRRQIARLEQRIADLEKRLNAA